MKEFIVYHDFDEETIIDAPNLEAAYELANEFGMEIDSIVEVEAK
jgi:hypothetical protein